ncbi:NUDIX domain-containing protein [Psychrobacter sp. I-STPA6b]|uniref:NUDIX domain-containing protein n=1 Tax=Psychrobacter sp. I-STPA6b TaxID=2585718 RepID=UPI001D0C4DE3|nr:NUDIX domain-containing protein [Psychrobacter sp. I-STPA6b]
MNARKSSSQAVATSYIDVAVAVIQYQNQYLLGYRHAQQHQGDCYEFVGGKVENQENPISALKREVAEEIGLQLDMVEPEMYINALGVISHDYGDKVVRLHVYRVNLSSRQYTMMQNKKIGEEGQPLLWVSHTDLLAGKYPLPQANRVILDWLRLPERICITQPVQEFASVQYWLAHYCQSLPDGACVYVRHHLDRKNQDVNVTLAVTDKKVDCEPHDKQILALLSGLATQRPDLKWIVSVTDIQRILDNEQDALLKYVMAQHMPAYVLKQYDDECDHYIKKESFNQVSSLTHLSLVADFPVTMSCHDALSILSANQLARQRIAEGLPAVVAMFVSPVLATQTHPDVLPLGWQGFSKLADQAEVPVIALGGLSPDDLALARQYGADKVAGIRQFCKNSTQRDNEK